MKYILEIDSEKVLTSDELAELLNNIAMFTEIGFNNATGGDIQWSLTGDVKNEDEDIVS